MDPTSAAAILATAACTRRITVYAPDGACASGGHVLARWREDGSVSIEGELADEEGGCPSGELEECLEGEAPQAIGYVVRCDTTMGVWSVTLGAEVGA